MEKIGTEAGFCSQTAGIWQTIGLFLLIFKIILPIILIVIGVVTFGKAVVSDDEKEIKKGYTSLFKKFIICVLTFFLPQIISSIFTIVVDDFDEIQDDYAVCKTCLVKPNGSYCKRKLNKSDEEDIIIIEQDDDDEVIIIDGQK